MLFLLKEETTYREEYRYREDTARNNIDTFCHLRDVLERQ